MTNSTLLKLCIWLCQTSSNPIGILQQKILIEALKGTQLKNIHVDGFSSHYIARVVAPNLWKSLSECCKQRVTIRRLRMVLTRYYDQLTSGEKEAVEGVETLVDLADFEEEVTQKKKLNEDVDTQIEIPSTSDVFYNQQQFIAQLTALIASEKHSLIFVYGGGGVGKTATVSETLQRLPQQHQNIVWCNLGDRLSFT
ncbi:MAG: hypothetical protein WBB82_00005, partial [Limnothrix sp.]